MVQDRVTFRSVILPAESAPAAYRSEQLLNDLGHEVSPANSPEHALSLLQQEPTDLLVVDVSGSARNREFVGQLPAMDASARPAQVAIISDVLDDALRGVRTRLGRAKVHVFLKPLHMHGLLNFLRTLEPAE
jgi:response regulator RpfG family c-di-GMP phosphodiesterase